MVSGVGNGNISISSSATQIDSSGAGITAVVGGTGNISIQKAVEISTNGTYGIDAYVGRHGNITIKNNLVWFTSVRGGIRAITAGGSVINITNNQSTIKTSGDGIFAEVGGIGSIYIELKNKSDIHAAGTGIVVERTLGSTAPALISSSATISGGNGNGFAIDLRGEGDDTVALAEGSHILGKIDFGNASPNDVDTLNFGPNVQTNIQIGDASEKDSVADSFPEKVNVADGGVLTMTGDTLIVKQIAGYTASYTNVAGTTTFKQDMTDNPQIGARSTTTAHGDDPTGEGPGYSAWASGMGGYRRDEPTDQRPGTMTHWFTGVMLGMETSPIDVMGKLGLVGGVTVSLHNMPFDTGHLETDTYFGGVYWKGDFDTYRVNVALLGGLLTNDKTRNVHDPTGYHAVSGRYNGYYLSPSLTWKLQSIYSLCPSWPQRASAMWICLNFVPVPGHRGALPLSMKGTSNGTPTQNVYG